MRNATAEPSTASWAALNVEWRELLVDAAHGDASLAALTSARLLRAAPNAPTLEETQLAIERFFELESEQAAAVMSQLAEEKALAERDGQQAA